MIHKWRVIDKRTSYIIILSNTFFRFLFPPVKTFLTLFVSFILWLSILWWCFEFFHGNLFQVETRWNMPHHTCKDVLHGIMQPLSTRYSKTFIVFLDEFWLLWCHVMSRPVCQVVCHAMSCQCHVTIFHVTSRHFKPFHVMLHMYVLIPIMSFHVICHLSHDKSGINDHFLWFVHFSVCFVLASCL